VSDALAKTSTNTTDMKKPKTRKTDRKRVRSSGMVGLREKPSLGVKPRWLVAEGRLNDLVDAMTRYRRGQYIIPPEWFEEAGEIARWLEASGGNESKRSNKQNV